MMFSGMGGGGKQRGNFAFALYFLMYLRDVVFMHLGNFMFYLCPLIFLREAVLKHRSKSVFSVTLYQPTYWYRKALK
jgi:hypothetical protein